MNTTTMTESMLTPDFKIVKTELFDPNVMDVLVRDTKSFSKNALQNLSRYNRGRKHGNQVEVVYHFGRGCEELRIGRLYVRDGQGLQAFQFDMRNPLLEKHYWDVDMENCHYWLMRQLCDNIGIKNDAIAYYCDNRDECLKKVSDNRGVAKTAFLKVAYGGNIKLYNEHYNDDGIPPTGDVSLLKAIEKEISVIIAVLKTNKPDIYKIAEKKDKKGQGRQHGLHVPRTLPPNGRVPLPTGNERVLRQGRSVGGCADSRRMRGAQGGWGDRVPPVSASWL